MRSKCANVVVLQVTECKIDSWIHKLCLMLANAKLSRHSLAIGLKRMVSSRTWAALSHSLNSINLVPQTGL